MFSIIISEKGGAERREIFDKTEINVGRVQGNDLMLPKGNVSKRHARLLFRDGRFIVTDLKSTNGTYVNGRKIAQATIVREGDKIYVGDFVLRIEATPGGPSSHPTPGPSDGATAAPAAQDPNSAMSSPARREGVVSHYPLENDPDEPSGAQAIPRAPAPPRLPSAPTYGSVGDSTVSAHAPVARNTSVPRPVGLPTGAPVRPPRASATQAPRPTSAPATDGTAGAALVMVVDRVTEMLDLSPLDGAATPDEAFVARVIRAIQEQVRSLKDDGEIAASVDGEALAREAQRELLGLGALAALLEDDEVTEVQVPRYDRIGAVRSGQSIAVEPAFSTEETFRRVIGRLCRDSGQPLAPGESIVDRHLPRGVHMQALLPPTALFGHVLVLRKGRRAELDVEDLVRSGTISRAMATFLTAAIGARANVLVTGPLGAGTSSLLGALARSTASDGRVVALQMADEPAAFAPGTICLGLPDTGSEGAKVVRAAARIHGDRLVVDPFAGKVAAEVLEAITEGTDGMLAAVRAPSLRQALERLVPDLAASRAGLTADAAREWLASSFDIAIEVARLRDGRHRVLRVAEVGVAQGSSVATQDVFTFAVERTAAGGALEGSFCATGVVPRVAEELASRGVSIDLSIFKRTTR